MKIEIVRTYASDDIDFYGDAYNVSMFIDGEETPTLSGDWYHEHIEDMIEGFLAALNYLKIPVELSERNQNEEEYQDDYNEEEDEDYLDEEDDEE